ncbi:MAG TPA: M23 family metallopeptidase [Gaiellaceae bacterium]|nr:M23 family metallopeptidase [Gaiellaceae bacterium]
MPTRGFVVLALGAALAGVAGAAAPPAAQSGGASARAYAVRIVLPDQAQPILQAESVTPPDGAGFLQMFQYPSDGSSVQTGALTYSVSSSPGPTATAQAAAGITALSLFRGEVTADTVSGRARATATQTASSGDVAGSGFVNLSVLGQVVPQPTPNERIALADWGYAILLEQPQAPAAGPAPLGYHGFIAALDVHLTADHGGLLSGTEIQVGYAEVNAQPAREPTPGAATVPSGPGLPAPAPARQPGSRPPEPRARVIPPVVSQIPAVTPKLTAGGYVFPVYGPASYGDTFGAPRADVGWHHGDDIFGVLGQPLLAVADGTVFSVGWNNIGGNRLWIRDAQGNEFYYAHLSAFSPLAVDGAQVHAGDVVGFMGQTGDARGTPVHLHFEVHPVGLLSLGYDGAVDPTSYLQAWQQQHDLSFLTASGWAPGASPGSGAPVPGAILLQVTDISNANGLEPGSLAKAMASASAEGGAALSAGVRPPARTGLPATPHAAGPDLGKG